ncbi:hypothetical protein SAMN05444407_102245 [Chryseobacterium contaminans]|uniref:Uncharacterized protein n=2 Tax=Chryseobacterium contaminans TaxID=1423959 RepID=A0A1M6XW38_9FLAO|nr:hypothetical protein SAMN05444407_102245 [Chryseobacterium contaminans]
MAYRMDFIQELNLWTKGDVFQGKVMVGLGLLLVLTIPLLSKKENTLSNGMLIPISLLLLVNLGYGSYLLYSRPKHLELVTGSFHINPKEALQAELAKMQADNKNYARLKPIWAVLIIVSVIASFLIKNDYYKGISLGLLCLSVGFLLIDSFLHHRLDNCLKILNI